MHHDTSKDHHHKKKKLKLTRKTTRKMLGKWSRLNSEQVEDDEVFEKIVIFQPQKVLGLPLSEAVALDPSLDGIPLPSFFRKALDFIEEQGLSVEGIYRLSPPKSRLDELERRANCGEPMVFADVHDASGIIKRFLRQIPESVVSPEFELIADSCDCGLSTANQLTPKLYCTCGAVQTMRQSLNCLEIERRTLFIYVFLHAQNIMKMEKENKMGLAALGLLLQTVLEMSRKLVCFTVHAIRPLFDDVSPSAEFLIDRTFQIKKYIPPKSSAEVEAWIGSNVEANQDNLKLENVKEELDKQHCLISVLHSKITENHDRGYQTNELDSQLWQVQNNITTLKRRVKVLADEQHNETVDSRCFEIYEEKQLMATQGMLREDIREEHRRISMLCWKMEKSSMNSENSVGNEIEEEMWKERCALEEAARSSLLTEISKLRSSCANLRARLEMISTKS